MGNRLSRNDKAVTKLDKSCQKIINTFRDPHSSVRREGGCDLLDALLKCENILEKYDSVSGTYGTPPSKPMGTYIQRRFLHEMCTAMMHRLRDPDMEFRLANIIKDTYVRVVLTCARGSPLNALDYFQHALEKSMSQTISDGRVLTDELRLRADLGAVYHGLKEQACEITSSVLSEFTFASEEEERLLILNFGRGQSIPREVVDVVLSYMTPDPEKKDLSDSLLPFYEAGGLAMTEIGQEEFPHLKDQMPDKVALLDERAPKWRSLLPILLSEERI